MMNSAFSHELRPTQLEELEDGLTLERFDPIEHSAFDVEASDFLFGTMDIPSHLEQINDAMQHDVASQFFQADFIQEIPDAAGLLPLSCGTSMMDVDHLLDKQDGTCEVLHHASLTDITESLAQDCRVLCKLSLLSEHVSFPFAQQAFCIAEVRGIDLSDPDAAKVSLATFGTEPAFRQCSLQAFMTAWQGASNACYVIDREQYHER